MSAHTNGVNVVIEVGKQKTFAVALDWPGWCRAGRDEAAALKALVDSGARYARALEGTRIAFHPPATVEDLRIVERLPGNATTDFGAPDRALTVENGPLTGAELQRLQTLLAASWDAFDRAAQMAAGKALRTGPRGGGRDLAKIVEHVRAVDLAYLNSLGGKMPPVAAGEPEPGLASIRQVIRETLERSARGEVPERGPRGGLRWTPRYFVRRMAWHELDHAWEIEDRVSD